MINTLSDPLVSIVTPSFNQGKFIEETIRSVLLQDYTNIEYIIIDGGSTDGSVDIIKKYAPRLTYWVSETDQGQADAVNKGWYKSSGEILAWLNSDDVYKPGAIYQAVDTLLKYPEAAVVYGQTEVIDELSRRTGILHGDPFELMEMLRTGSNYIPQPSAFIRRSVLQQLGMLDINLHMAMDYDLWLRTAVHHSIVFVPEVWSLFRRHESSKTVSQLHRFGLEGLEVINRLFSRPDLPQEFGKVRNEALAWANIRAASSLAKINSSRKARSCMFKALLLAPKLTVKVLRRDIVKLLFGPRIVRYLKYILPFIYKNREKT